MAFLRIVAYMVLASSLVFANGSQENVTAKTYTFKVSITQSATDPLATYTKQWISEVETKTNGNVKFQFYPNGELGTINDVCEQVARGASIIAYAGPDAYPTIAPDMKKPLEFSALAACPLSQSDFCLMRLFLSRRKYVTRRASSIFNT